MLDGLLPAGQRQANLFGPSGREQSARLMESLDGVNKMFGAGTLRYRPQGFKGVIGRCDRIIYQQ